jgi:hypothetical protein
LALPKLTQPLFEITIPSTKKKTTFRPYTLREEKILLVAKESADIDQIILAIKQIISSCVQNVDVEKLALFDLEFIIMNIRSKSVGEEIDLQIEDPETKEKVKILIKVSSMKLTEREDHSSIINVDGNTKLIMRYPTINELGLILKASDTQSQFEIMMNCLDSLVVGEEYYKFATYSEQERIDFFETIDLGTISKIKTFFETIPTYRIEAPYTRKDGTEKTFVLEGLQSFFI